MLECTVWFGATLGCGVIDLREGCAKVVDCRFRALSRTATMLSTRRNRRRCLSFCGRESRYGIFLGTVSNGVVVSQSALIVP